MMLDELKAQVLAANLRLQAENLVIFTWGNVSGFDRRQGLMVIKPSGVPYEELTEDKLVVLDLDGQVVEGGLRPSSDTPTHLYLYKHFPEIGGVAHTHSTWGTIWAQAKRGIPCYGTTHADYFYGEIPCTRQLKREEIREDYELNTGKVIVERFKKIDPNDCPGALVAGHAPFTWGGDPVAAVYHSVVLEEIARMAFFTRQLSLSSRISRALLDKHYLRKHGRDSYYGQETVKEASYSR